MSFIMENVLYVESDDMSEIKPKTIREMKEGAKSESTEGKFVIIPKNMKAFKKGDKNVMLPTDNEVRKLNN